MFHVALAIALSLLPGPAAASETPECSTFESIVLLRRDVDYSQETLSKMRLDPELRVFFSRRIADAKRAIERVIAMWQGPGSPSREMLFSVLSLSTEFRAYSDALPLYASFGSKPEEAELRRQAFHAAEGSLSMKVIHHDDTDVYVTPDRLARVLRRHHPAYFDPAEVKNVQAFQTFFPDTLSPERLCEILSEVVKDRARDIFRFTRNRVQPSGEPMPETMSFASTVAGRTYTVVLDREAKLVTFYPHENPT